MPLDASGAEAGGAAPGVAPILVFAYGNPSRGDDALGPALIEQIAQQTNVADQVELLTDFQLQVEHALDLVGRQQVVFVDASVSCIAPFVWQTLAPVRDASYTSHVMSPTALLQAYVDVLHQQPPPCHLLSIRGYQFELGEALSDGARANLDAAVVFFVDWVDGFRALPAPVPFD